jgi:hypothetical protein
MKLFSIFLLSAIALRAQSDSPNVQMSNGVPNVAYTKILAYSGTNLSYICEALSTQPTISTITVTSISNANPGIVTAANHGFYYASGATQKILVYISGATGGWATLNGLKVLTPTSSGLFSIQTTAGVNFDTSGFGAWGAQAVVVSTRAPKTTSSVWSVQVFGTESDLTTLISNPVAPGSQSGIAGLTGGSTALRFPCALPSIYQ